MPEGYYNNRMTRQEKAPSERAPIYQRIGNIHNTAALKLPIHSSAGAPKKIVKAHNFVFWFSCNIRGILLLQTYHTDK